MSDHSQTPDHVQVLLPKALPVPFDYALPAGVIVTEGSYVQVPLGNQTIWGVVWHMRGSGKTDAKKLKTIQSLSPAPPMAKPLRNLITWCAEYTLSPLGNVLAMSMPVKDALEAPKPVEVYDLVTEAIEATDKLTDKQQKVVDTLKAYGGLTSPHLQEQAEVSYAVISNMAKKGLLKKISVTPEARQTVQPEWHYDSLKLSDSQAQAASQLLSMSHSGFQVALIDGVTGSGKTEVYLEAVKETMRQGKQVLLMLPEISLTGSFMARLQKRFGFTPTLWHSGLTPATRRDHLRDIMHGNTPLVIGARSALFLPYADLGLIIVDEEHESTYKQEDGVLYHGRDMAVARGHHEDIPVLLVSATPSIETLSNVAAGKYKEVQLSDRFGDAELPDMQLVDMRTNKMDAQHFIAPQLKEAMVETLEAGHQALLFLNRRGYAPLVLCRACGYRFESPEASSWMVMHYDRSGAPYLQCHHTGFTMPMPTHCPSCHAKDKFAACGPGVERLREEAQSAFPDAKIALLCSDTIDGPTEAGNILTAIEDGKIDIIIGTQVVAKGHHFPKLTLVGVIDADLGLEGGDLRASERTFQLLHQVAGRAGRAADKGRALIQTYHPGSSLMQQLITHDRNRFIEDEMERRKSRHLPPFGRMAALILQGTDEAKLKEVASQMLRVVPHTDGITVWGPAPAPIYRLRDYYRLRFLVHGYRNIQIQKWLTHWLEQCAVPSTMRLKVDIDPQKFM